MSHGRAARLVTVAVAVSSGLLAATLATGPAFADTPGTNSPGAGCAGQSCWVTMQSRYIILSGDYTNGPTGYAQVPVPPPPCWMNPGFSGPAMYQLYLQSKGQRVGPSGVNPWGVYKQFNQAIIHNRNSPGMWYMPTIANWALGNPACNAPALPNLAWVPPGASPPPPPISPATLAAYAYDHLKVPSPTVVVNPAARSYVTLPTYVWASRPGGAAMPARLSITATAAGPGGASVTLTATAGQLDLSAQNGATAYSPCPSPGGSKYPVGQPPKNSGPGITPDCGVVFTAPSTGNMITARVTYNIAVTGANLQFPAIPVQGSKVVTVAEIQNLNG